jgi:hypothetical protein
MSNRKKAFGRCGTANKAKKIGGSEMTETTDTKIEREPDGRMTCRRGKTDYNVSVMFSKTSKETIEDKLLRIIEMEMSKNDV